MTLSRDELDEFAKSMARAGGRDSQHVGGEEHLVVSSAEAHWIETASPSQIGLLLRIPASSIEIFFLQKIPPGGRLATFIDTYMSRFTSCNMARAGRKLAINACGGARAASCIRRRGSGIATMPTTGATWR